MQINHKNADINSCVYAVIQLFGHSPEIVCQLAVEIWELAAQNKVWLVAAHIKCESDVVAHSLSGGTTKIPWSKWLLCPRIMKLVFAPFGTPNIDLFTSQHNKVSTYCSWDLDPAAYARDSLSMDWKNIWGYAYPLMSLIPRILRKILQSRSKILLIAPWWPLRPWFPGLLDLLVDIPAFLPTRVNPDLESLKLTVAIFQQQLIKEGVPEEARQMVLASWRPGTIRVYAAQSVVGLTKSRNIPLRHL